MNTEEFKEFLMNFEKSIVIPGFKKGLFKSNVEIVPINRGRLAKTKFADLIGEAFDCKELLSINYYGLFKHSTKIYDAVESVKHIFGEVKTVKANVVYFNSIKIKHIEEILGSNEEEWMKNYQKFKDMVVDNRWNV